MMKKVSERVILGLDPGTTITGYAVICSDNKKVNLVKYGIIRLGKGGSHELKLKKIFEEVLKLIDAFIPDEVALEAPFFGKNVQSALKLGRAQGVAMAAALSRQIPITEYAPRKVKQAVTGNGNASKEQVARMLLRQFGIKEAPRLLDATDALAVALCHHGFNTRVAHKRTAKTTWKEFVARHPERMDKTSR
ncbi:MAG: crossover junction endodeoxyribonuclease RuvC [Cyclobacteriaceae bacterium]|nr:MAG: crossover junction endodeoxyribonuclease RuvC [Cyclobacteriaceae bacterium]